MLQFGIGGGYICPANAGQQAEILSLCLAENEILGDLGVERDGKLEYFPKDLVETSCFRLSSSLLGRAKETLSTVGVKPLVGNFITVNSASGTERRGELLRSRWNGLCENMEGAAAARICALYDIPMLELRVISNLVEDRNLQNWRLGQACEKAGKIAALLVKEFS